MKTRVAVVGAGYWGKNLLRNFDQLGALYAICESDKANSNTVLYEKAKTYVQFDELIKDKALDAVAISSPAVMHYEMAKKALNAGKDVYVEKPLALTITEGEELVELANKAERILMVGHILQYHPAVIRLREMIANNELGKIQYIYSNRLNIGKLRTEENILWSFAPHDISIILMLLGEEPIKVQATGGDYLNKGIQDTTLTSLEFRNGVKGHIFVSWLHPFKEQKLVVVGSRAMAVFDDVSSEKLFLYPHTIDWSEGKIPIAHKADCSVIPFEKAEPLREELKHFLECIETRRQPKTDGREGLSVLRILSAAEESLANSNRAVSMSRGGRCHADDVFIHESAIVDDGVSIGKGSKVWHFSHLLKNTKLGEDCIVGQNVVIGPDVAVGSRCKIQNNVSLYRGVTLEDEVFCGPSAVFTNVYNPRAFIERKNEFLPTLLRRGATIGANATIVCGTTIGKYAMIGAGSVVKKDVPDHAVVAGVPAKQIGWACKCGTSLKFKSSKARCGYCNNEYALMKNEFTIVKEN